MREDRSLELVERAPRFDAELGEQRPSRGAVCLERLGLPSGAVQRDHQLAAQAFPERMSRHQRLELRHQVGVSPEREVGLDPLFDRRGVKFFQAADLVPRKLFEREIREGGAAPERECLTQLFRRLRVRWIGLAIEEGKLGHGAAGTFVVQHMLPTRGTELVDTHAAADHVVVVRLEALGPQRERFVELTALVGREEQLRGADGGQLVILCNIEVKKNRITSVTISAFGRQPRCQCGRNGPSNGSGRTCIG